VNGDTAAKLSRDIQIVGPEKQKFRCAKIKPNLLVYFLILINFLLKPRNISVLQDHLQEVYDSKGNFKRLCFWTLYIIRPSKEHDVSEAGSVSVLE
jgi:hypothetical protein